MQKTWSAVAVWIFWLLLTYSCCSAAWILLTKKQSTSMSPQAKITMHVIRTLHSTSLRHSTLSDTLLCFKNSPSSTYWTYIQLADGFLYKPHSLQGTRGPAVIVTWYHGQHQPRLRNRTCRVYRHRRRPDRSYCWEFGMQIRGRHIPR